MLSIDLLKRYSEMKHLLTILAAPSGILIPSAVIRACCVLGKNLGAYLANEIPSFPSQKAENK